MLEFTAYHEAGHALVALMTGANVHSVTIDPDWDDGPRRYGDTRIEWPLPPSGDPELVEKAVFVALAGPVAEMIYSGEPFHPALVPEWKSDWQNAWQAAASVLPDDRARLQWLEQTTRILHQMLSREDCWAALAAISDHLLAHETLESEQLEEIASYWMN